MKAHGFTIRGLNAYSLSISKPSFVVMADCDARLASEPPIVPQIWMYSQNSSTSRRSPHSRIHPPSQSAREVAGMRGRYAWSVPRHVRAALGSTEACYGWPRFILHPALRSSTVAAHHHILKTLYTVRDPHPVPGVGLNRVGLAVLTRSFSDIPGFRALLNLQQPTVHLSIFSTRNRHLGHLIGGFGSRRQVRYRNRTTAVTTIARGVSRNRISSSVHHCRPGFEDEVMIPPWYTASIDFLGLTELADEFKFIPVMEYHRFILLHGVLRVRRYQLVRAPTSLTTTGDPPVGLYPCTNRYSFEDF